jgi:hypothetical protein
VERCPAAAAAQHGGGRQHSAGGNQKSSRHAQRTSEHQEHDRADAHLKCDGAGGERAVPGRHEVGHERLQRRALHVDPRVQEDDRGDERRQRTEAIHDHPGAANEQHDADHFRGGDEPARDGNRGGKRPDRCARNGVVGAGDDDAAAAWCPYASPSPYVVRIAHPRAGPSFGHAPGDEVAAVASTLRDVLTRLGTVLDDPPYNVAVLTAPRRPAPTFHWYLEVTPRVTVTAGFEQVTGLDVNTVRPDQAAADLRAAAA